MSSRRIACNNVGPCSIGKVGLRQMGLKWPYSMIGMWFGEDQRANIIRTRVQMRLEYVFIC